LSGIFFLFGTLRARFFLYTGISVARRRQSTKSQVTTISVNRGLVAQRWIVSPSCARGKKEGGGTVKEEFARGGGVLAGNYRSAWGDRARQGV